MKKIGILDIRLHPNYLLSTARIFKTKDNDVTIFTIKEMHDLVSPLLKNGGDYSWVMKGDNEPSRQYLKRIKPIIDRDVDLLLVNTVQGGTRDILAYYLFNPRTRKIISIHNPKNWFGPWRGDLKEKIKSLLKRRMLKRYDAIAVVSDKVKKYVIEQGGIDKKPVYVFPFSIHESYEDLSKNNEHIVFVAAGKIEKKRRNYHDLLDVFERVVQKYPEVELKILGKPEGSYGRLIISRCSQLKAQGCKIFVSQRYLDCDFFESEMRKADILIAPVNMNLYDESKETGAVYDAIRFAKPVILPEGYAVPGDMLGSPMVMSFKDWPDLNEIIEDLIKGEREKIELMKGEARKISSLFTAENVRKKKRIQF